MKRFRFSVGLALLLFGVLGCSGEGPLGNDGSGSDSDGGVPPPAPIVDALDAHRPAYPHISSEKSYSCTDASDGEHTLTVHRFKNAAKPEVPPEERGLSTSVFFRDDEYAAFAVVSGHGGWSFKYSGCTYTWLFEMRDFSQQRLVFDPTPGSKVIDSTRPPMIPPSAKSLAAQAAQFNDAILDYAASQLGNHVGNGECWTLAERALDHAGAHFPVAYIFGSRVGFGQVGDHAVLKQALPGDVIQFDAGHFEFEGGSSQAGSPVHTAIVKAISGEDLEVYEQNAPMGGPVRAHHRDMATMVSGGYFIYRAYPLLPSTAGD